MKRGYADTPEGQVHYVEEGQGEPILLLHQSPRSSRMFLKLLPLLGKEYRAIAMDMLGYGYSDSPPRDGDAIMALAGNAIHLLDALGIEKAHLFGIHTGAVVAGETAAGWPERIGSLTLYAYTVIEDEREREIIVNHNQQYGTATWRSLEDGSHLTKLWVRGYADVIRHLMHTAKPPSEDFYLSPENHSSPYFVPSPARSIERLVTDEQIEFINWWVHDAIQTTPHIPKIYVYLYGRDTKTPLTRIQAPTLHIEPDSPYEVWFNHRGKRVAELVPQGENIMLPGADDNSAEFNPPLVADAMLDWLRKHPI